MWGQRPGQRRWENLSEIKSQTVATDGKLQKAKVVMVERDLPENNAPKVEYRFLKKTSGGLPKEVNTLAAQGFRFLTGRRVGTIVMILMAKQASDATTYTAIDERKFAKEFEKTIAAANHYQGVLAGDLTCGSTEVENEKLLFVQNAERRDYKIIPLSQANNGEFTAESVGEFQRLLRDGYRVKELFYANGVNVIIEK